MHAEVGLQMERESDNEGRLSLTSLYFEDDQKLRLIDISQEDDDLLSDSPFLEDLRLSATYDERGGCNFLESLPSLRVEHVVEKLLQKEQELSPSLALVPESPCHARKSLAWDTAFFTNAGILDNDELTFINEGFKAAEMQRAACEDVRTKIFEPGHSTKGVAVSSAPRKLNTSVQNKTCKSASERASMSSQRSVQNKAERLSKRGEPHWLSLKAPKVSSPMINLLTGKGRSASIDAYHAKKANRAATMRSVHSLQLKKKSALENPCKLLPGSPSPELVSPVFPRSNKGSTISSFSQGTKAESSSTKFPSALLERKTHSERRNFSISTSISDATLKYLEKDPESGHPKCSTQSLSLLNNCSCLSSSATSSVGSCSGPRSMAKHQSREMGVYPDTSVTLTRTINSENEVIESPYLLNDLRRKSTPFSPLKEVASSLVERTYLSTPDTFCVPTESRRKLKPSYLRLPSPKIGFFDEKKSVMSTLLGSLHLQFETQCTSPSRSGPTNGQTPNKHPRAGTSTETKSQKFGSRNAQLQNPGQDFKARHSRSEGKHKRYSPKVWSTMKARSEVDFGFQSGNCGEVGEWICSKCRKTGAGELDRKKVGRISVLRRDDEKRVKGGLRSRLSGETKGRKDDTTIPRGLATPVKKKQYKANNLQLGNQDETRMLANFEDRVNDLSKYFEAIDLSKDMATEDEDEKDYYDGTGNHVKAYADTTFSSFIGENVTDNQKVHKIFANHRPSLRPSLSATKLSPSSRTPLAKKTSISKRSGSLKQIAKEKLPDESSMHGGSDKENSFPYGA